MAYNEEQTLRQVTEQIVSTVRRTGRDHEVIVVDDGSTDQTGVVADEIAGNHADVRVIHHALNQGLGGVYRTGFADFQCDLVTFFPADGQYEAEIIEQFLALIEEADLVLGTLTQARESCVGRALSYAERILYRLLFGPLPSFQGIFMVRRTLLEEIPLTSDGRGWTIVMELIIRASRQGHRIKNVPISVRPRVVGQSKVNNVKTIMANLWQVFELRNRLQ